MNSNELFKFGREANCPQNQLLNFARAHVFLQPKQLAASAAARECDKPDGPTALAFGGARGGGKSHWLLAQVGADDCQRFPGLKCLLLRKVGKSNLENFEDLRRRVFPKLPHIFVSSKNTLTFENGSRIIAGHYQHESDIDAYLGLEYDLIAIEEATTLTHRKYLDISTCCRTSKVLPDGKFWRPRIYCTANPGGVGHAWFKKLFVDPHNEHRGRNAASEPHDIQAHNNCTHAVPSPGGEGKDEGEHDSARSAQTNNSKFSLRTPSLSSQPSTLNTRFIPATIADNRYINPEYTRILERLTGWQKRAWLHGDWDIAAGQFFTNFRRDLHVIQHFDPQCVTEWYCAMDYGFTHYTVVLLGCLDGDGNFYVLDEHAARQWLPDRHARAIFDMLRRNNLHISQLHHFVAGADCFSTQYDGHTIAKQYEELGITLRTANTERIHGWAEILKRFGDPENGIKPSLFIHERCRRVLECLPHLQHDPTRPEDVLKIDTDDDGDGGDDAADALRYLVSQRAWHTWVVSWSEMGQSRPLTQLERTRRFIAGKPVNPS